MTSIPPARWALRIPVVLRQEPQFRLLFIGQVLSILGDRVTSLVLPFAVLAVGGGVAQVALVSAAQFIPFALLALPAGVWADRLNRKTIIIISDTVRLLCQITAAVLLLSGNANVTDLAIIAALYGAADAFFNPAFTGLVTAVVSPANLQQANALRGATFSISAIAGPALGALLVALVGPGGAFSFDAVTFVLSIICTIRLRPRIAGAFTSGKSEAPAEKFFASLRNGWVEVRSRPWVVGFLGGWAAYAVFVLPAIFVLGPVLATTQFGGASGWATITVAFGIGSLIGDFILLKWRPRFALRVAAFALVGASCQAGIIGSGLGVWPIAGLELITGICVTGCFTLWQTSLQEHISPTAISRVASYDYLTSTGMIPLGNAVAAFAGALLGVQRTLFFMSGPAVLAALLVVAIPAVRKLPRAAMPKDTLAPRQEQ